MLIRAYTPDDLSALTAINADCVPNVSAETRESLGQLLALGTCLVAVDEADLPRGFVNLVAPGTMAYPSENLRWFERWMVEEDVADLVYVDRIAVAEAARGQRLGEALYEAAYAEGKAGGLIGCEVNDDPPNPGSHRFHRRLGFERIGVERYRPGYTVSFYVREV
ncbi:GNAT family N-acetyltransferase [Henriciella aquimarina]|uniref:GNAT family N-acetyltransferase n=1 Tax=Henriciella aquimarina TaxID=545261 RepID=UPI00117B8557|nr:GNAT family N-acetyltransferase [Henriciella aquimarina]